MGKLKGSVPFLVNDSSGAYITPPNTSGAYTDSFSNKSRPMTESEWQLVFNQAGFSNTGPTSIWGFQESSGPIIDLNTDSSNLVHLTANNSPTGYNTHPPGWEGVGVQLQDGTNQSFSNTTLSLNSALTSTLLLAYIVFPPGFPGGNRQLMSTAVANTVNFTAAGKISATYTLPVTLNNVVVNQGHVVITRVNLTASTDTIMTEEEKANGLYLLPSSGALITFGAGLSGQASGAIYLYAAEFSGAAAEMTDNQIRSMLQALGWVVLW